MIFQRSLFPRFSQSILVKIFKNILLWYMVHGNQIIIICKLRLSEQSHAQIQEITQGQVIFYFQLQVQELVHHISVTCNKFKFNDIFLKICFWFTFICFYYMMICKDEKNTLYNLYIQKFLLEFKLSDGQISLV